MCLRWTFIALLSAALAVTASAVAEEKSDEGPKALCPVMGGDIDKSTWADYLGAKVYFCCPGCSSKFTADTAKYATKANLQLVLTGQASQVACPLTGRKTNPKKTLKVGGVDVAFCCGGCLSKVSEADKPGQRDLVFGTGFKKGYRVKEMKKSKKK